MPVNKNALIRYKAIDNCLRNHYRRWTLDDLIEACSAALDGFEDFGKGISRRTVQMDIQMMRSDRLGYNAPIEVYENKYYRYSDRDYSIFKTPLIEQDLKIMSDAVVVLRQFIGFSYFSDMTDIINRLDDRIISAKTQQPQVIDFEKNENLIGLKFLDIIYHSIIHKQTLNIKYQSFKSNSPIEMVFYPYLLKEYRNRWFVFGACKKDDRLYNLALDRIHHLENIADEEYVENRFFNPENFFDDCIGVSKNINAKPETVRFWASPQETPYIQTKPLHKSQKIIEQNPDGSAVFEMEVIINFELTRDLFAYSDGLKVMLPLHLAELMRDKLYSAASRY